MQRIISRYLLLLCLLPLSVLAGERLETVIRDLHTRGTVSPDVTVKRLQAADDRPGPKAPLAQRQRYYAVLGEFTGIDRNPKLAALAQDAQRKLEAMAAREGCDGCLLDARMIQAQLLLSQLKADEAASVFAGVDVRNASLEQQLRLHTLRGWMLRQQGQFAQCVVELVPAEDIAAQLGYTVDQAATLNLLSTCNTYLGDFARAESNGNKAFALAETTGSRRLMAATQLGLGYLYAEMGQQDRMLKAYQQGLESAGEDPNADTTRVVLLSNLADYWLRQKDYQQALDYAQRAEVLAKKLNDTLTLAFAQTNAGVAKAHLGDMDGGIAEVRSVIDVVAKDGTIADRMAISQELADLLEYAGRYREALTELRGVMQMRNEFSRQERNKTVLELQERYAADKRQREIERLGDVNRLKEMQQWLWAALVVVLVLAALLLMQWLKRARTTNKRLQGDVAVLAEQSARDPLTGAFNRRQGHHLLARHVGQTDGAPALGLMMLDIDFFKLVNDDHGHAAGDRVLVEVVKRLQTLLRNQDAVVRWGGEEFLLLLPGMQLSKMPELAGRVLRVISEVPVTVSDAPDAAKIPVTASMGCVVSPFGEITNLEALVQLADLALYKAKGSGRNQAVCVSDAVKGLNEATLGQDLMAAAANGMVQLTVVAGPEREK